MTEGFAGKVAVVTGAGSGIGRALAEELARRGAKLALSDIDTAGLRDTVHRCGDYGMPVKSDCLDVTEREAVLAYAEDVKTHYGIIHQIYNNAGIAFHGDVEHTAFKDFERVVDVDFWGVVNGTKAFLPHLIESGEGHVVNVSSLFGLIAVPGQSAYNAAKFAVRGFTEALREEMLRQRTPVRVTCVHPGGVKTAVARNAMVADSLDQAAFAAIFDRYFALHSPEMAARTIIDGVSRGKPRVLIGAEAKALDALARLTGAGYQRIIARIFASRRLTVAPTASSAIAGR